MKSLTAAGIFLLGSFLSSHAVFATESHGGTVSGGTHLSVTYTGSGKPYGITATAADNWEFREETHISNTLNWYPDSGTSTSIRWGKTKTISSDNNNELFSVRIWGKIVPVGPGSGPPPPTDWSVRGTLDGDFRVEDETVTASVDQQTSVSFKALTGASTLVLSSWEITSWGGTTINPDPGRDVSDLTSIAIASSGSHYSWGSFIPGKYFVNAKNNAASSQEDTALLFIDDVTITNKQTLLYFYPKKVYSQYASQIQTNGVAKITTENSQPVDWSIENDGTGGTAITDSGALDLTGKLTLTNNSGFFDIRVSFEKNTAIDDNAKSSIYNVDNVLASMSEALLIGSLDPGIAADFLLLAAHALGWGGGHSDAHTHLYWQALVEADHRYSAFAEPWGYAHEKTSLANLWGKGSGITVGSPPRETTQDLHNNPIGRNIGKGFYTLTSEWGDIQLQTKIQQAVLNFMNNISNTEDPYKTLDPNVSSQKARLN